MTLSEKIGQLNLLAAGEGLATGAAGPTRLAERLDRGELGAVFGTKSLASARAMQERALAGSRLSIPLFFAEDVIHGHRTVFPLPIALACSWDMALIEATASHAACEAAAEGLHQVYAPMIDVARDPRWGRIAESPGEDPLLAARYAVATVRGLQGAGIAEPGQVAACLKHFVAYGATLSGRDYDNASLAWEDLIEIHLAPFVAGLDVGAASVMASFNAVNRLPMHANAPLIDGWLRGKQGFDGLVVSDYTGVQELSAHGIGAPHTVVARALHAGIDMDMVGEDYLRELPRLAVEGLDAQDCDMRFTPAEIEGLIDRACSRVLDFKARLGLLDDPYRGLDGAISAPPRAEGRALARRAAAAACVLLKNDRLLPLKAPCDVALVGPFAEDRANMLGTWSVAGDARDVVTLREALEIREGVRLQCARGCNVVDEAWLTDRLNVHGKTVETDPRDPGDMIAEAVAAARTAGLAIVAVGEAREHGGESSSRLAPDLPAPQRRLIDALSETGVPLVIVVFASRPLALGAVADAASALLYAWHGGIAGPEGVADILFGDAAPSGRLAASLPAHPGEVPLHHSEDPTGRPFRGRFEKFRTGWLDLSDDAAAARYPFGFGLTYSRLRYDAPVLSSTRARGDDGKIELRVTVTNEGDVDALETVQLYLSDPVARVTRPARRLIDFQQIAVASRQAATARFTVTLAQLRYPLAPSLEDAQMVWDPGSFVLHVGPNSRDTTAAEIVWER
ncbi:MAG: glycoside hydrolase family 3 C-terminal domain-containing protein [Rhodobacteraceae bacterium]|nr:glycoside hydrolase family 3 C-terminal domain-containing protein [Paracoccaceae bacterium]